MGGKHGVHVFASVQTPRISLFEKCRSNFSVVVVEECKRDLLMVSSPDGVVRQIAQWFEITCDTRWNVYNLLVKVKMPQRVCECANGNIDPQQHSRECISVP